MSRAAAPHRELGLTDAEYEGIVERLGREPNPLELAVFSLMWSEHCAYKHSRKLLRELPSEGPHLLMGPGENAGVVDVGDGLAVAFKVESHNHPSAVEPFQGAATGVGGILRDIFAVGARPIAVLDSLRFGELDSARSRFLFDGAVSGIGHYGNSIGVPTVGGEVYFEGPYEHNCLVNAMCVGIAPRERLIRSAAAGPGNLLVLLGALTGRDGIGGVSVLASAGFDADAPSRESGGAGSQRAGSKRPSVQVGDPFTEKTLVECCLELYDRGLVVAVQDLGGAGLTCATSETAAAGGSGMHIRLERVPLREPSMAPLEILTSESQERMLAVVTPADTEEVLAVCARWGVLATVIGTVTDTGRLVVTWHDDVVCDVPPASLADGPVYSRPTRRPGDLDVLCGDDPAALPRPADRTELRDTLVRMVGSPNLCSRRWVTEQYDRYVQGNTVLAAPEDAGVVRLDESSGVGIAISLDGNGRYCRLDPYAGAQLALAEAYRNVAVTGARPLAVTNCLNFGSPEDPEVMWQFAEAVRGLADGCEALGVPVTGGNVSFYNATGEEAIHPTPVVGVLGVFDDVARRTPIGFTADGELLYLLGDTRDEFGGSEWAHVVHGHLGGRPPRVALARERLLAAILVAGSRDGMLSAAHDLSDGGLAQALVESCLRGGRGARIVAPAGVDPFVFLFAESAGRTVVALPRSEELRFTEMCDARGLPCARIGVVDGEALEVQGSFVVPLDELRAAHERPLPALFE